MLFKYLHQPREVKQRSAQPVDLIDNHTIDPLGLDMAEQALQSGPLQVGAAEAAIVVTFGYYNPACLPLATDIGFRTFPLCVQGVEFLT
jgi:hypothetical protein